MTISSESEMATEAMMDLQEVISRRICVSMVQVSEMIRWHMTVRGTPLVIRTLLNLNFGAAWEI